MLARNMSHAHPRSPSTRQPRQVSALRLAVPQAPPPRHHRSGPGAWVLAVGLGAIAVGCDEGGSSQAPTPASTASAAAAEAVWEQSCASCHRRSDKQGRTAEEIRKALRDVPSMRPYAGRLSDADIDGLARLLAPASSAAPAP
jgi:cytochrome c553